MDVDANTYAGRKKPRCVIVYDSPEEYEAMRAYAKGKGLDLKNFLMWAAISHMTKYPQKAAQNNGDA